METKQHEPHRFSLKLALEVEYWDHGDQEYKERLFDLTGSVAPDFSGEFRAWCAERSRWCWN